MIIFILLVKDTCTGFLLGGIGEINAKRQKNFLVVTKGKLINLIIKLLMVPIVFHNVRYNVRLCSLNIPFKPFIHRSYYRVKILLVYHSYHNEGPEGGGGGGGGGYKSHFPAQILSKSYFPA